MSILANMNGEQFEATTLEEMTLLHLVALEGNVKVIHMMKTLPYFRDIVDSNNNEKGYTPLMWAAQEGDLEMIQALVEEGGA